MPQRHKKQKEMWRVNLIDQGPTGLAGSSEKPLNSFGKTDEANRKVANAVPGARLRTLGVEDGPLCQKRQTRPVEARKSFCSALSRRE